MELNVKITLELSDSFKALVSHLLKPNVQAHTQTPETPTDVATAPVEVEKPAKKAKKQAAVLPQAAPENNEDVEPEPSEEPNADGYTADDLRELISKLMNDPKKNKDAVRDFAKVKLMSYEAKSITQLTDEQIQEFYSAAEKL